MNPCDVRIHAFGFNTTFRKAVTASLDDGASFNTNSPYASGCSSGSEDGMPPLAARAASMHT